MAPPVRSALARVSALANVVAPLPAQATGDEG